MRRWPARKLLSSIALAFLAPAALAAEKGFQYSPDARLAYEQTISLRLKEAGIAIQRMKQQEPENLIVLHLENYADFFRLYISENEALYGQLKKNEEARIRQIQEGDPRSPYFLYLQADIRLQWSLLKFHFGDYLSAFLDISKSYKLLRRNQELFPAFLPNLKNMGILHALAGTIPDNYRWGARLLTGMTGTVPQGKAELEKVLRAARDQPFLFEEETLLLYTFVLLNLSNEPEKAWKTVSQAGLQPAQNPVHCYLIASVAMQSGRNEEALSALSKQPLDPNLLPFPHLQFMHGTAKLRKLDLEAARHFQSFLNQYKGRNGIKEAYQRLAWCAFLKGDLQGYQRHLRQALSQGAAETGADKNALKEAQSLRPSPEALLKARLLFDGGYFQKAFQLMQEQDIREYQSLEHRLEYYYRTGRILHGLKRYSEAIASYQKSIALGKNAPFYFACNAALQTGMIYETLGKPEQAKEFFRLCLSMNPDDYRTSLHQAAKAGLSRI